MNLLSTHLSPHACKSTCSQSLVHSSKTSTKGRVLDIVFIFGHSTSGQDRSPWRQVGRFNLGCEVIVDEAEGIYQAILRCICCQPYARKSTMSGTQLEVSVNAEKPVQNANLVRQADKRYLVGPKLALKQTHVPDYRVLRYILSAVYEGSSRLYLLPSEWCIQRWRSSGL